MELRLASVTTYGGSLEPTQVRQRAAEVVRQASTLSGVRDPVSLSPEVHRRLEHLGHSETPEQEPDSKSDGDSSSSEAYRSEGRESLREGVDTGHAGLGRERVDARRDDEGRGRSPHERPREREQDSGADAIVEDETLLASGPDRAAADVLATARAARGDEVTDAAGSDDPFADGRETKAAAGELRRAPDGSVDARGALAGSGRGGRDAGDDRRDRDAVDEPASKASNVPNDDESALFEAEEPPIDPFGFRARAEAAADPFGLLHPEAKEEATVEPDPFGLRAWERQKEDPFGLEARTSRPDDDDSKTSGALGARTKADGDGQAVAGAFARASGAEMSISPSKGDIQPRKSEGTVLGNGVRSPDGPAAPLGDPRKRAVSLEASDAAEHATGALPPTYLGAPLDRAGNFAIAGGEPQAFALDGTDVAANRHSDRRVGEHRTPVPEPGPFGSTGKVGRLVAAYLRGDASSTPGSLVATSA